MEHTPAPDSGDHLESDLAPTEQDRTLFHSVNASNRKKSREKILSKLSEISTLKETLYSHRYQERTLDSASSSSSSSSSVLPSSSNPSNAEPDVLDHGQLKSYFSQLEVMERDLAELRVEDYKQFEKSLNLAALKLDGSFPKFRAITEFANPYIGPLPSGSNRDLSPRSSGRGRRSSSIVNGNFEHPQFASDTAPPSPPLQQHQQQEGGTSSLLSEEAPIGDSDISVKVMDNTASSQSRLKDRKPPHLTPLNIVPPDQHTIPPPAAVADPESPALKRWTSTLSVVNSGLQWKRFWLQRKQMNEIDHLLQDHAGPSGSAKMTKEQILQLRRVLITLKKKKTPTKDEIQMIRNLEEKLRELDELFKSQLETETIIKLSARGEAPSQTTN